MIWKIEDDRSQAKDTRKWWTIQRTSTTEQENSQAFLANLVHQHTQLHTQLEAFFEFQAAYKCRQIFAAMQYILPQELRDIIYGFLAGPNKIQVGGQGLPYSRKPWDKQLFLLKSYSMLESWCANDANPLSNFPNPNSLQVTSAKSVDGLECAHIFDENFTDPATRVELVEAWYRNAIFVFRYPSYLTAFLMCERWEQHCLQPTTCGALRSQ